MPLPALAPRYDLDFKNPETKAEDWITSDALAEMYQGFIKVRRLFLSQIFIILLL